MTAIKPRTFRTSDELWQQVLETTERRGETASGVIVAALTRYVRRHAGKEPVEQSTHTHGPDPDDEQCGYVFPSLARCQRVAGHRGECNPIPWRHTDPKDGTR